MISLYKATSGIIHLVQGGYICNHAIGNVNVYFKERVFKGTRKEITCKNCLVKLN